MRVILYTGKGGVGKTSVAAATAVGAAKLGYRTIVLSTDSAHSLSDSFEVSLGTEPRPIAPNLWGQETEITQTVQRHWGTIKGWVMALMQWRGLDEIMADEMAVLPGMEELANLLYIVDYACGDKYDVVIVDCAPTADTLRLLSFPEVMRWWMEKLFPIERKAAHLLRPIVKPIFGIPFPEEEVFDAVQTLFSEVLHMRQLLTNAESSSVRLVLNAEKMVIKEAQRTFTYLNLYGYPTDLVVCNRLIPDEVEDSYFDSWKESQLKYYRLIEESFAPLPILGLPLFAREVVGLAMLEEMGQALFGSEDPTKLFYHGQPSEVEKEDGYYVLTLPLPFVSRDEVSLSVSGDELVVVAGRHRRNITLPRALLGLPIEGAKYEGERLRIRFQRPDSRKRK